MNGSAHWMNTELGIPSGPGALWGLRQEIGRLICVFVIAEKGNFWGGYSFSVLIGSSSSGDEKNAFMKALVFSSFDAASMTGPSSCFSRFSVGTRALPPSDGDLDAYQCAVHTVLSSTDCRKSSQCVLLAVSIIVPYWFLAVL